MVWLVGGKWMKAQGLPQPLTAAGKAIPATVDDMRVYNRALTPTEVKDLYNIGLGTVVYGNNVHLADSKTSY